MTENTLACKPSIILVHKSVQLCCNRFFKNESVNSKFQINACRVHSLIVYIELWGKADH